MRPHYNQDKPTLSGWLQKAVAWHLMEDGVATRRQLIRALACDPGSLANTINAMDDRGLLTQARPAHLAHMASALDYLELGLTRRGVELAILVTEADWRGCPPVDY